MRILAGVLFHYAERYCGRSNALQIPEFNLYVNTDPPEEEDMEEVPDNWIMETKDGRLVCGREQGFYFLSPIGFQENRGRLQELLGDRFEEYERAALDFFDKTRRKTFDFEAKLRSKSLEVARSFDTYWPEGR